jgi:hypothetical protein
MPSSICRRAAFSIDSPDRETVPSHPWCRWLTGSPPRTGVTWFSTVSLAAAMSAGILFGFTGRGVLTSGN